MTLTRTAAPRIAAVAIGRNEGARLLACLDALQGQAGRIVYVDSGSTDGSVEAARARGAEVVSLDMTLPFTAARARNAGIARLTETGPRPELVQFVDGDCILDPGWIPAALACLDAHPSVAVACGRRRERFPEASVYNRLCDREWNTPVGPARACGGDALMRLDAIEAAGLYNPTLIAGEEPELCVRLRAQGWEIRRLDAEMTLHDADMHRFGQWWTRMRRSGHAWAEGAAMHGAAPERHCIPGLIRALTWGAALPALILAAAILIHPAALLLAGIYPLQVLRLARRGGFGRDAWETALFMTLGKFPETQGALGYALGRLRRRPARLIEYKGG
ncbi:Glycosyltransferase, GT2 family [Albimonas donghaensis]|uniref:Glycosyltransferase, GT2 family n=1 Tax=Albimonas donghaensis TaxID=356660 RepID=A0A1H3FM31_9RHOB|nr:glycosyltransferase [Albimonas donghaensis]SDX92011.1 Glycosyltransferase, GT2 family [Albimonas donghaensis]